MDEIPDSYIYDWMKEYFTNQTLMSEDAFATLWEKMKKDYQHYKYKRIANMG